MAIVTSTLTGADTGEELATVYVLGSPNPVAGHLRFVASGGAIAPPRAHYSGSA